MSYVSAHSREFEPMLRVHARNDSVAFVRLSDVFPTTYEQSELLPTLRRAGVQSAIFLPCHNHVVMAYIVMAYIVMANVVAAAIFLLYWHVD